MFPAEIQTTASVAALRLPAADIRQPTVDFAPASRMVAPGRHAVPDVAAPMGIVANGPAHRNASACGFQDAATDRWIAFRRRVIVDGSRLGRAATDAGSANRAGWSPPISAGENPRATVEHGPQFGLAHRTKQQPRRGSGDPTVPP